MERAWKHINFFLHHNFQEIVVDKLGNVIGMALARPIASTSDVNSYEFDKDSDLLFVDFVFCDHEKVKPILWDSLKKRFPKVNRICFFRSDKCDKLKTYNLEKISEKF